MRPQRRYKLTRVVTTTVNETPSLSLTVSGLYQLIVNDHHTRCDVIVLFLFHHTQGRRVLNITIVRPILWPVSSDCDVNP